MHTRGAKAYAILGEYGSGKTYLLRWLEREELPKHRIRPFFFDNPGLQFYDLANTLLRQIGREEFAKALWEFLNPQLPRFQPSLFRGSFQGWLQSVKKYRREEEAIRALAEQIHAKRIAHDEEIRYKLGRLIVETYDRPYFEYKDFVAGRRGSLVAEREEAPYFAAILRALRLTGNAEAVAFLLDEFEEVSLQKRLTKRQAHDYLATTKRLIGLTEREQFWIIVAMTPQAAEVTEKLEPALWQRFISQGKHQFEIPPLNGEEAEKLVRKRLDDARPEETALDALFPFPENLIELLREDIKSSPRRLVKVCSLAIAQVAQAPDEVSVPFTAEHLQRVQEELYPHPSLNQGEGASDDEHPET
ncbi:hypothetical protein D6833_06700 [Candidatus Parcubacteria bacterium]|nr:MAG: hypothetical protein D6833_06700 [Candidatus Parcubacteria bacterium]